MAGKEIDRVRARGAVAVIRQHPLMVLLAISPVLLAAVVVGYLTSAVCAILLLVVAAVAGTWIVVRKR